MIILEIAEIVLSIIASIISIAAVVVAKQNKSEIKKLRQEIRDSQIENSNIYQAGGDIKINSGKK